MIIKGRLDSFFVEIDGTIIYLIEVVVLYELNYKQADGINKQSRKVKLTINKKGAKCINKKGTKKYEA